MRKDITAKGIVVVILILIFPIVTGEAGVVYFSYSGTAFGKASYYPSSYYSSGKIITPIFSQTGTNTSSGYSFLPFGGIIPGISGIFASILNAIFGSMFGGGIPTVGVTGTMPPGGTGTPCNRGTPPAGGTPSRENSSAFGSHPGSRNISPEEVPTAGFAPWQQEIIDEVLGSLSPEVLAGIGEIVGTSLPPNIGGMTQVLPGKGRIIMNTNISPEMFKYALVHEVMHAASFYAVNPELVREFYSLFDRNPANHVTAYSMTRPEEDLAETLTQLIKNGDALLARAQGNPVLERKLEIARQLLGEIFSNGR